MILNLLISFSLWGLLGIVVFIIGKEILSYLNLQFYTKQGMKQTYVPFFGVEWKRRSVKMPNDEIIKFVHETVDEGKKAAVFNSYDTLHPTIVLTDPDLFDRFLELELDNFQRKPKIMMSSDTKDHGFFYAKTEKALVVRKIFSKFFNFENVESMIPGIQDVITYWLNKIVMKHWKEEIENNKQIEAKSVNLRPVLDDIFEDVVNMCIFGTFSKYDDSLKIENTKISEYLDIWVDNLMSVAKNLFNMVASGLLHKLQLLKKSREAFKVHRTFNKWMKNYFRNRVNEGGKIKRKTNLLDLIIGHNKRANESGKLKEVIKESQIVEEVITFNVAGTDTSRSLSSCFIEFLSKNQEIQNTIVEDIKNTIFKGDEKFLMKAENYNNINLNSSTILDSCLGEGLRMFGPAFGMFDRTALRNVKVGEFKIKKGTIVFASFALHTKEGIFKDALKFDLFRFKNNKDKIKKMKKLHHMPFSAGGRACIGKYFGIQMVKMILMNFLSKFEWTVDLDNSHKNKHIKVLTRKMSENFVNMKPKAFWIEEIRKKFK